LALFLIFGLIIATLLNFNLYSPILNVA
jgi:hypothetical protein